jgi:hypothetical protein
MMSIQRFTNVLRMVINEILRVGLFKHVVEGRWYKLCVLQQLVTPRDNLHFTQPKIRIPKLTHPRFEPPCPCSPSSVRRVLRASSLACVHSQCTGLSTPTCSQELQTFSTTPLRSSDVSKLILVGRLGKDPEVRMTRSDKEYIA